MWELGRFKHIFGKPNTGIHSYRFFNISLFDVLLTILVSYYIQKYILQDTNTIEIMIVCFLIGIITHRIFGVRTTIDKFLF